MLIHELGEGQGKAVVMLHGLGMSWDMLRPAAERLAEGRRVFCVAVPGMDMDENNEFTSVEDIALQNEDALLARGVSDAGCLYGLSMGGGLALRMLADNRIHFDAAIIDAGITPYELPRVVTRLILVNDVLSTRLGRASKKLLEIAFPPERYTQAVVDRMSEVLRHMTWKTTCRAYDSTDNYSMPERFPTLDTDIQYWYGSEEKKARKLDIQYVQRHVPKILFRELPGMAHGQYAITRPAELARDIEDAIEKYRTGGRDNVSQDEAR